MSGVSPGGINPPRDENVSPHGAGCGSGVPGLNPPAFWRARTTGQSRDRKLEWAMVSGLTGCNGGEERHRLANGKSAETCRSCPKEAFYEHDEDWKIEK